MIRISQIKGKPQAEVDREFLCRKAADILRIRRSDIAELSVVKRSVDARKKPEIYHSYVIDVRLRDALTDQEERLAGRVRNGQAALVSVQRYRFPKPGECLMRHRPIVAGMGPCGLFCGYYLALHGYRPLVIERGRDVDARTEDVRRFWETGVLNTASNVQFGEGGAGAFSDGKLNTLIKDRDGRNREVLETLVHFGAPEHILYDAKPHIGTDVLTHVVKAMREEIRHLGGEVRFETQLLGIKSGAGHIESVTVTGGEVIPCDTLVLAIGHSARDTFEMLYNMGIPMEAKAFAVGMRVEHPQAMINWSQYGQADRGVLGAASYKLTAGTSTGRGVYSFCMCPGGYVVNASSEEGRLAVNGMSYSGRDGRNANSAIIVAVTPEDYGSEHPLAGIAFQRQLEERAYQLGQGRIPVQRYGLFRACVERACAEKELSETDRKEYGLGKEMADEIEPAMKGAYQYADVSQILPAECSRAFVEGMEQFGRKIKGFDRPDALISGVESRTSSPVRIHRDETCQSALRGLYPCGEGAGYAGGITSAAMDGLRIAEEIAAKYQPLKESMDVPILN